jgi:metal-responsive CopG/Arc/MetJ family transcriptional regulator
MYKKITVTLSDDIYEGLRQVIKQEDISQFIEALIRSYVQSPVDLEEGYRQMAMDEAYEAEAAEWVKELS